MKKLIALLLTLSTLFAASCAAVKTGDDGTTETKKAPDEQTTAGDETTADVETTAGEGTTAEEQTTAEDDTTADEQTTHIEEKHEPYYPTGDGVYLLTETLETEVFDIKTDPNLSAYEYVDENAPKMMKYTFLGEEYDLVYYRSGRFGLSDVRSRSYIYKEDGNVGFMFDEITGNLIKAWGVKLSNCDENGNFISDRKYFDGVMKKILGEKCDLSEYDEDILTTVLTQKPGYTATRKEDGFYSSFTENESAQKYSFFYTKKTGNHVSESHCSFSFAKDFLFYELILAEEPEEVEYSEEKFESFVKEYLKAHIAEEQVVFVDVKYPRPTLYQYRGNQYLRVIAEVLAKPSEEILCMSDPTYTLNVDIAVDIRKVK